MSEQLKMSGVCCETDTLIVKVDPAMPQKTRNELIFDIKNSVFEETAQEPEVHLVDNVKN